MDSGQAPTTREDNKDIDVADEAGVTLYDLAYECEDLFDARLAELAELGGHRWRFAIWAEDLGVFARKSQSLDKKLENHPDLVDLVVRLLGVLRVNLAQLQRSKSTSNEPTAEDHDNDHRTRAAARAALEATFPQLKELRVKILRASLDKIIIKNQMFISGEAWTIFTDTCRFCVQVLYPECHPSLREYLAKTMTARYKIISYQAHPTERLQVRCPRRPSDEDLKTKTYPCIWDECPDRHPARPSFDAWFYHMTSHGPMWHQRVYPTQRCVRVRLICENNYDVYYKTVKELHRHLTDAHGGMFDADTLRVNAQGSKLKKPRAWNECLMCYYPVEGVAKTAPLPKRQKRQLSLDNNKRPKATTAALESQGPSLSRKLENPLDDSLEAKNQPALDDAKTMARHIAGHLQTLMLLTIRFASMEKEEDNDEGGDDDANSGTVEPDDASDATRALDPKGQFRPLSFGIPLSYGEVLEAVGNMAQVDPIPDAVVDFDGVPRPHDGLPVEEDEFLQEMIKSGGCQEHLHRLEHEDGNVREVAVRRLCDL